MPTPTPTKTWWSTLFQILKISQMTYLLTPVPCSGLEVKVRSWNVGSEQLADTFTGYKFAAVACWARALGCKRTLDTGAPPLPPHPSPHGGLPGQPRPRGALQGGGGLHQPLGLRGLGHQGGGPGQQPPNTRITLYDHRVMITGSQLPTRTSS